MLTTKQQLEPILKEFTRLKNAWGFDENKGIEQLNLPDTGDQDSAEFTIEILIDYGRFLQCVDLISNRD